MADSTDTPLSRVRKVFHATVPIAPLVKIRIGEFGPQQAFTDFQQVTPAGRANRQAGMGRDEAREVAYLFTS